MKEQIINILENISLLLQIKGESFFKFSSYSKVAEIFRNNDYDIELLVKNGQLTNISGIGNAINEKISDFVLNGRMQYYEKITSEVPESLIELLKVDGLGPKKVFQLYKELNICTLDDLNLACQSGEVAKLKGFSENLNERILDSIKSIRFVGNYKDRKIDFDKIQ
jgi:DNA polymerase (family X)